MTAWLWSTRGLATLLAASLGANLFLGGIVAGRITGDATQGSPTRRSIEAMLGPLPDAKRKLVRQEVNTALPRVREQFAALQKARAALAEEMVKPDLDGRALERGFAAVRLHTVEIGVELQQAIIELAEQLKKGQDVDGATYEDARPVLKAMTDNILLEVEKTFDFFKATASNDRIDRIVLSGGASRVDGFPEALAARFGTEVMTFDPFRQVSIDPAKLGGLSAEELAPVAAVAVGLALRKVGDR